MALLLLLLAEVVVVADCITVSLLLLHCKQPRVPLLLFTLSRAS
jgi:hypothetical protein